MVTENIAKNEVDLKCISQVQEVFGFWEAGINAGGSRNNLEKFAINPQYSLTINQPGTHQGAIRCATIFVQKGENAGSMQ